MKAGVLKMILKPLLPKLEQFFNSQELEEDEISSSALINIKNNVVDIRIVTLSKDEKGVRINRVIDSMTGEDLVK